MSEDTAKLPPIHGDPPLPAPIGSGALNKTDVALCFISYAAAIGFLAAHDWKLVAALAFWGCAKLCWADAQRPNDKVSDPATPQ